jgi:hypothetical protein
MYMQQINENFSHLVSTVESQKDQLSQKRQRAIEIVMSHRQELGADYFQALKELTNLAYSDVLLQLDNANDQLEFIKTILQ